MTHTEESLMALAFGISRENGTLRNALRDVLAERDEARKSDGWQWVDCARADRATAVSRWRAAKERAEKSEAECEILRKRLQWCYSATMSQMIKPMMPFEAWTQAIDAAMKNQP